MLFTYTAYMATLPILLLSFLRQAGQWVKILTKQKSQVIKCIRQKCVTKFHQSQTLCGWNVGDILNFNKVQEKSTLIYRFIAFLLKMRLRWVKIASVYGMLNSSIIKYSSTVMPTEKPDTWKRFSTIRNDLSIKNEFVTSFWKFSYPLTCEPQKAQKLP